MALAEHHTFPIRAPRKPIGEILKSTCCFALPSNLNKEFQRSFGITDDPQIRHEDSADLSRFDIHMNESTPLRIDVDRTGMAISPAVADTQHEVARQHGCVPITMTRLQPTHPGHKGMVIRDRAPAHERRHNGHTSQFCKLNEKIACIGINNSATCHDQWLFRRLQHIERLLDLFASSCRLIERQWLVQIDIELNFGNLHIKRQIDKDRSGAPGFHDMECLLKHLRNQRRLSNCHSPFRNRLRD